MNVLARKSIRFAEPYFSEYPFHDKSFFALWVSQIYHIGFHLSPLLKARASEIKSELLIGTYQDNFRVGDQYEAWALLKLKQLDLKITDFPALPSTKRFYEELYSSSEKRPAALLGCLMALELIAEEFLLDANLKAGFESKAPIKSRQFEKLEKTLSHLNPKEKLHCERQFTKTIENYVQMMADFTSIFKNSKIAELN